MLQHITEAKVYGPDASKPVLVKQNDDGKVFIETPVGNLELVDIEPLQMVDGEITSTINFIKQDGKKATIQARGEVDVARTLFKCAKKPGRKLVTADDYLEILNNRQCGELFEVIRTKNKETDVRINCAYLYDN